MTREEIIDGLEIYTVGRLNKDKIHIAVEELQKFIDEIKTLKQEPCEDCISRKNTLAEFKRLYFDNDTVIRCAELVLGGMPSVTSQTKTGHWILSGGYWRCSECKEKALLKLDKVGVGCREYIPIKSNYCPNCGRKMMQEVEDGNK